MAPASSVSDPAQALAAFPRPSVTCDIAIFRLHEGALRVLLIQRGLPPFEGRWALPGGFLRVAAPGEGFGESLDAAAARELREETGLSLGDAHLEQVGAFGDPGRDPRGRVITVLYAALLAPEAAAAVRGGGDAATARWFDFSEALSLPLAFDHDRLLRAAHAFIVDNLDRKPLAFALVPRAFTASALREAFEAVGGRPLDPANFQRRVRKMVARGVVEPTGDHDRTGRRPARLYRFRAGPDD